MSIKKLIWSKSYGNLKNFLSEAFKNNIFHNVTFVLDDDTTQMAHKFIICAASPLIRNILANNNDDHILIHIHGYKSNILRYLLELIYSGECFTENHEATEVIDLAIQLQIYNIQEMKNEDKELESTEVQNKIKNEGEVSASVSLQIDNKVMVNEADRLESTEVPMNIKNEGEVSASVRLQVENEAYRLGNSEVENDIKNEAEVSADIEFKNMKKRMRKNERLPNFDSLFCPSCQDAFKSKAAVKSHYRSVHLKIKWNCSKCDKVYPLESSLRAHIKSIHEAVISKCDECSFQCTRADNLRFHVKTVHEKITMNCNHCDFVGSHWVLRKHVKENHGRKTDKFKCDDCTYTTLSESVLKQHVQFKHAGVVFPCDQCNYKAQRQSFLDRHFRNKHEGFIESELGLNE